MALAPEDVDAFIALAHEENLEATPVAVVTEKSRACACIGAATPSWT
ncbi:MAG: hypothetical protein ACLUVF_01230 [Adlercreutzia sp.]